MQSIVDRRLIKEVEKVKTDKTINVEIECHEDNTRYFKMYIYGPKDTPYEGGKFELELFYNDDYPQKPPRVRFVTKIYHPNVDQIGRICLDILKEKWSPVIQMRTLALSLSALLQTPNFDDPLDVSVAKHFQNKPDEAKELAKKWVVDYCSNFSKLPR
jgi:ubiquitin-conjugating enzyme E2 N